MTYVKLSIIVCVAAVLGGLGLHSACAQTDASTGRAVVVATPTPGPVGTSSTALNSSLTAGSPATGQGSMGTGVNVPASSAAAPIVPSAVTINSNASSVGTGNVAGSVQINNGGPGSVTGVNIPLSPIPTYVTPGTGLGTATTTGVTTTNPNPGSVQ